MAGHRRPAIPFSDAPRGSCRWCGETIVYESGPKRGSIDRRRRWHPACVDAYQATDPREARRRVRRRDRGVCAACRLDTYELRRRFKGRGRRARLRAMGFDSRRSLWELDHVVPLIDGGSHELGNLQTLCVPCHRDKSAREQRERSAREPGVRAAAPGRRAALRRVRPAPAIGIDELLARADELNARVADLLRAGGRRPR